MKYETAKELKDAGFPQDGDGGIYVNSDGSNKLEVDPRDGRIGYYIPTLEELIEACGRGFQRLDRQNLVKNPDTFWALSSKYDDDKPYGTGTTPSEAVANLWLALNKIDEQV